MQRKVKRLVEYEISIGKGYMAIGAIIRHMIHHKKMPREQAYYLEKTLHHYMPKDDLIDKFYERV